MKLPDTLTINHKNIKVYTPTGFQPFLGINKIKKNKYIHLKFQNGSELKCSLDHPLSTIDGVIKAKDLDKNTEVYTKNGGTFLKSYRIIKKEIELYDIVNSGEDHLYYTNDIVSHNCNFLGSVDTLVTASKLKTLVFDTPVSSNDSLDVYMEPKPKHTYLITVDTSEGISKDYHAFIVFDVTSIPYRIAAKYKNNELKPMLFADVIYRVATAYNQAYVLFEIASVGEQVAKEMLYDLEYDNLLMCSMNGRAGQKLSMNISGKRAQYGIKMSKQVKRVGCSNLKTIIEDDKLLIRDYDIISELTTFISKNNSYEAEIGCNDDLAICLVIFAWVIVQDYFKDLTNNDVRKKILEEQKAQMEEDMSPFGFILNGVDDAEEVLIDKETGDYWLIADQNQNMPLESFEYNPFSAGSYY